MVGEGRHRPLEVAGAGRLAGWKWLAGGAGHGKHVRVAAAQETAGGIDVLLGALGENVMRFSLKND